MHPKFRYEEFKWRSEYLRQAYVLLLKKIDMRSSGQILEVLGFLKMSLDCGIKRFQEFKTEWDCYDAAESGKDPEQFSKGRYIGMVRENYPDENVILFFSA